MKLHAKRSDIPNQDTLVTSSLLISRIVTIRGQTVIPLMKGNAPNGQVLSR